MEKIDYDALIKARGDGLDKIDQSRNYARLRDIARNMESMAKLVDAEEKERELEAEVVASEATTAEDAKAPVTRERQEGRHLRDGQNIIENPPRGIEARGVK